MSNLIERLRMGKAAPDNSHYLMQDAAAEIERLRAEVERLEGEVKHHQNTALAALEKTA